MPSFHVTKISIIVIAEHSDGGDCQHGAADLFRHMAGRVMLIGRLKTCQVMTSMRKVRHGKLGLKRPHLRPPRLPPNTDMGYRDKLQTGDQWVDER